MSVYNSSFLRLLRSYPSERVICQEGSKKLTVGKLIERSLKQAFELNESGLKRGDHVLFAMTPGIEFLISFMALIHLRVKIALVDPHMGPKLFASKIKQLNPQWTIADNKLLLLQENSLIRYLYLKFSKRKIYIPKSDPKLVFGTGQWLPLRKKYNNINENSSIGSLVERDEDDEIVIVYTSGSLSEPKGVVHSLESILSGLNVVSTILLPGQNLSMASHLPHFALIGMITGYTVHFWKESLSAKGKIDFIKKHKITTIFGPPSEFFELLQFCNKEDINFPDSLEQLILGSAPVYSHFVHKLREKYKATITCYYGMTEHMLISIVDGDDLIQSKSKNESLGRPNKNVDYKIAEDGELLINSRMLFKRYLLQNERPKYHATGDLVELNSSGELVMMGRKKNMIIRGDKNIYPSLHESVIIQIPEVKEAVFLGKYNHEKHDEEVFLLVDIENSMSLQELERKLKNGKYAIDSDAYPDFIIAMKIPRSGRQQKVDYKILRKAIAAY